MTKYTQQKTIRIYDDVSGAKFVVEESPDPGTIDLKWFFSKNAGVDVEMTDIPVDLALEIARALNEVANHITQRDNPRPAIGGVAAIGATPLNPNLIGRN